MSGATTQAVVKLGIDSGAHLDGTARTARNKLVSWGRKTGIEIGRSIRGGFDTLKDIAGFGGIAGLAMVTRDVIQLDKRMMRLGLAARMTRGEQMMLKQQVRSTALALGAESDMTLGAVEGYTALTGRVGEARDAMEAMTGVMAVAGTDAEATAQFAAAAADQFGLAGKEAERAFSIFYTQGKDGSIELSKMAGQVAKLSGQFTKFGTKGAEGFAEMGALLQAAGGGFGGDAAQTSTAMAAFMTSITRNWKELKGKGIKVFDEKGARSVKDIAFDLLDLAKGDPRVFLKLLKDKEAVMFMNALATKTRDQVDALEEAGLASKELRGDMDAWAKSDAGKMVTAQERLAQTMQRLVEDHMPKLIDLTEKFAGLLDWIAENPVKAILGMGAMKFGPSLAATLLTRGGGGNGAAGLVGNLLGGGGGAGAGGGTSLMAAGRAFWGPAGLVTGAAAAGYALGTLLDKATGLSDVLAGVTSDAGQRDAEDKVRKKVGDDLMNDPRVQEAMEIRKRMVGENTVYGKRGSENWNRMADRANALMQEAMDERDGKQRERERLGSVPSDYHSAVVVGRELGISPAVLEDPRRKGELAQDIATKYYDGAVHFDPEETRKRAQERFELYKAGKMSEEEYRRRDLGMSWSEYDDPRLREVKISVEVKNGNIVAAVENSNHLRQE